MTDIKRIGSSGIHTVEGNVAGTRAAELTREREKQQAMYETVKNKIKEDNSQGIGRIDSKFSSATDVQEQEFRKKTVGLVTADEFRKAQAEIAEASQQAKVDKETERKQLELNKKLDRDLKRKKVSSTMSFADEEGVEDEEETTFIVKKKVSKNPNVDTSFLPDATRDRELQEKKEELRVQWLKEQEEIKKEKLEVVYSYWDGSGHRKSLTITKGMTVGKFLEQVKAQLNSEFREIRSSNAEDLCYVKEDMIIPQHISFYDLIITKARGKSGPLFYFDVHDDVRLVNDATIEKEESHPGKVVERRWYEKNKHIFPYSRWEWYDPKVIRDGGYSLYSLDKK